MQGLQLTADLRGCALSRPAMTNTAALRQVCFDAVASAGLQAVGELFHRFVSAPQIGDAPSGITGVVLLAESHLAVHTWPELEAATLDVYVCNLGASDNSAKAHALMDAMLIAFAPTSVERQAHRRGELRTQAA
ncbi:MAG: S-adenosylmethionine decarboxylase [Caldimonas sp.]